MTKYFLELGHTEEENEPYYKDCISKVEKSGIDFFIDKRGMCMIVSKDKKEMDKILEFFRYTFDFYGLSSDGLEIGEFSDSKI